MHVLSIVNLLNSKTEQFPLIFFRALLAQSGQENVPHVDFSNTGEKSIFGGLSTQVLFWLTENLNCQQLLDVEGTLGVAGCACSVLVPFYHLYSRPPLVVPVCDCGRR